jgi:hypothetical protein
MSKHEQARKYVDDIDGSGYFQRLHNYINEAEATEKAYEELKQELKELSSLQNRNKDIVKIIYGDWGFPKFRDLEKEYLQNEFKILHYDFDKLSKVGVEE